MFVDRPKMFGFFIFSIPLVLPLLHKLLHTHYYSLRVPKNKLEHAEEEEEEQVNINKSWSELDSDILGEILDRLCLADQLRFHVVCKNWLHAHPITSIKKPLLWYLTFDRSLFEFQLHDPSSSDPASVQNISLSKLGIPSPCSYKCVSSILLNNNWLFICIRKKRLFFWKRRYYNYLLFSPFTKKVIILPKLDYPRPFKYLTLTSSSQPDSSDCVFFLINTSNAEKVIRILSYRNGDKEWTAKEFNTVTNFKRCHCNPVYLRGILYIVSPYGQLASYNIVDGEFKFETLFIDELFRLNIQSSRRRRVFEFNGELMMIYYVPYKKKNVTLPGKPCINRYNWSNKDWIPISTLGGKSLFFSENNIHVAIINEDDNGVLSNKIYQFFKGGCLIYSIEMDGELIEFKSIINSNLTEERGCSDLPEYKYKGGSVFSGTTKAVYWLETPLGAS